MNEEKITKKSKMEKKCRIIWFYVFEDLFIFSTRNEERKKVESYK